VPCMPGKVLSTCHGVTLTLTQVAAAACTFASLQRLGLFCMGLFADSSVACGSEWSCVCLALCLCLCLQGYAKGYAQKGYAQKGKR
jgi:hypothetical protein